MSRGAVLPCGSTSRSTWPIRPKASPTASARSAARFIMGSACARPADRPLLRYAPGPTLRCAADAQLAHARERRLALDLVAVLHEGRRALDDVANPLRQG